MPVEAKPKPLPPSPHGHVHTAGKQDDHFESAFALATKLGWSGDPSWVANEIAVVDAQGYLGKVLHEAFIAGAKDEEAPSHVPVSEHLAITESADQGAIQQALTEAYEAGKGAELTAHPIVHADLNGSVTLHIHDSLRAALSAGNAG